METVKLSEQYIVTECYAYSTGLLEDDNLTESERNFVIEDSKKISALFNRLKDVEEDLKLCRNGLTVFDEATVKSTDREIIVKVKETAESLIAGKNIYEEDKAELADIVSRAEKFIEIIDSAAKNYNAALSQAESYDQATVTSADKEDIQKLCTKLSEMSNCSNYTEDELSAINEAYAKTVQLEQIIESANNDLSLFKNAAEQFSKKTVKRSLKDSISKVISQADKLLASGNYTEDEKAEISSIKAELNGYIALVDELEKKVNTIESSVSDYAKTEVNSSHKQALEDILAQIDGINAANAENLEEDQTSTLETAKATAEELIAKIDSAAKNYNAALSQAESYDQATVTSADKEDIQKLRTKLSEMSNCSNYTEDELSAINEAHAKTVQLEQIIESASNDFSLLKNAAGQFSKKTVKRSLKDSISEAISQADKLLASGNYTEDEKAEISSIKAELNGYIALVDELEEKVNTIESSVSDYAQTEVNSSHKQALEDILAQIDSINAANAENLEEDQTSALETAKATAEELIAKINSATEKYENVAQEVGKYDSETVNPDNRESIKELITDIDSLLSNENYTQEEKAELEQTKAQAEELLKIIDEKEANCICICHCTNKVIRFFYKIFNCLWKKLNIFDTCCCGAAHY